MLQLEHILCFVGLVAVIFIGDLIISTLRDVWKNRTRLYFMDMLVGILMIVPLSIVMGVTLRLVCNEFFIFS